MVRLQKAESFQRVGVILFTNKLNQFSINLRARFSDEQVVAERISRVEDDLPFDETCRRGERESEESRL